MFCRLALPCYTFLHITSPPSNTWTDGAHQPLSLLHLPAQRKFPAYTSSHNIWITPARVDVFFRVCADRKRFHLPYSQNNGISNFPRGRIRLASLPGCGEEAEGEVLIQGPRWVWVYACLSKLTPDRQLSANLVQMNEWNGRGSLKVIETQERIVTLENAGKKKRKHEPLSHDTLPLSKAIN